MQLPLPQKTVAELNVLSVRAIKDLLVDARFGFGGAKRKAELIAHYMTALERNKIAEHAAEKEEEQTRATLRKTVEMRTPLPPGQSEPAQSSANKRSPGTNCRVLYTNADGVFFTFAVVCDWLVAMFHWHMGPDAFQFIERQSAEEQPAKTFVPGRGYVFFPVNYSRRMTQLKDYGVHNFPEEFAWLRHLLLMYPSLQSSFQKHPRLAKAVRFYRIGEMSPPSDEADEER